MRLRALAVCAAVCAASAWGGDVRAQGLLWSLPPDGTWVRYEGEYRETEFRPNAAEGDEVLSWDTQLTIKSVGTEKAAFEGREQPCRWIEFKIVTGKTIEGVIDPGPVGARIYKVLVPESRITGQPSYLDDIPVSFIPIVAGYRQVGNQPLEPIQSGVLQIYPNISLLQNYKAKDIQQVSDQPVPAEVAVGPVNAMLYKAAQRLESPTSRSLNEAELWRSDDVPFGLARWKVRVARERKDSAAPRSDFKPAAEFSVEMKAAEKGTNAQSELVTP